MAIENALKFNRALLERLRFIDLMLLHYGKINRAALEDMYGISTPQASLDFAKYMELAPNNMTYDRSGNVRSYVVLPTFSRIFD